MIDPRIGKRLEIHPALDPWMQGDRYGECIKVSKKCYAYIDPNDPRNGHRLTVRMDKSGRRLRLREIDVFGWID